MNKKIITGTIASAVILGGAIGAGAMTDNFRTVGIQTEDNNKSSQDTKLLSMEEAKKIALAEYDGVVESFESDKDWGKHIYEIEIDNGAIEYELDMDAVTGEILKVEEDHDDDDDREDSNQTSSNKGSETENKNLISEEEAIKIATDKVAGTVNKIERDKDDGRVEYEIEIRTDTGEADIEIDAETGEILSVDYDRD